MWAPSARSPSVTASIRSVSFARSSRRRARRVSPCAIEAREREERQLVDEPRHLVRRHLGGDELGVRDLDVGDRLAGRRCAG